MRFRVICQNPKTGQSHEFELDAHDRREAEQQVVSAGLVVSRIAAATGHAPPDPPGRTHPTAAEQEALQERRRVGIAARVIAGSGIVVIAIVLLGSILSGGGEAFTFHEIQASVRFDGARFTVVNMDDFAWHNVLIDVNGGLANHGYVIRADMLAGGQALDAASTDFVSAGGGRFDPANEPLRQLRIICDIGDGKKALHTRRWEAARQ